jgi:aquaporin Z
VSFGLWVGKRFPAGDLVPYIIAQVVGATVAGGLIFLIASGRPGFTLAGSNPFATNGYAAHSPGGYSLPVCLIVEVVLTFMFLLIILGTTDARAPQGLAPMAIGFALTLIHPSAFR